MSERKIVKVKASPRQKPAIVPPEATTASPAPVVDSRVNARSKSFNPDEVRPLIRHLLDSENPDINDPFFPLFAQYEAWEEAERKKRATYKSSLGANNAVSMQVAQQMWDIGRLESDGDDFMLIHTKEAMRLFIGRGEDPEGKVSRIPGAKMIGTTLRHLWFGSGADNPYADWALLMAEQGLDQRIKELEQARERAAARIKELQQQGLHLTVLRSANPVKLELGFKSPYGFLIAHLVVVFDHFVRIIKTLQARDLIGADEARLELRQELRPIRTLFDQVQRQESILQRTTFSGIKRADFASSSVDVRQRISEINAMWPGLPEEVLTGKLLPRHTRRQQQPVTIANVAASDEVVGLI